MKFGYFFAILPLVASCGVDSDYTGGSNTGVVITKNPKGQSGGSTEVKQMELHAPWLAEASELYLEIKSVILVDGAGQRETVGVADAGTYLLLTRARTGKIEFYLAPDQIKTAKNVEVVVENVFAKRSGKSLATYGKSAKLILPVIDASAPLVAYTSVSYLQSGVCALKGELAASAVQAEVSEKCGGNVRSDGTDSDGDDDSDDDNDSKKNK